MCLEIKTLFVYFVFFFFVCTTCLCYLNSKSTDCRYKERAGGVTDTCVVYSSAAATRSVRTMPLTQTIS